MVTHPRFCFLSVPRLNFAAWLLGAQCLLSSFVGAAEPTPIRFRRIDLERQFRSEGVAVADYNRDGKQDIAAGFNWYESPDWKRHPIAAETPVYDPKGYANSFVNAALDVNHDGWMDILIVDFPGTPTWWFQNPGEAGGLWTKHELTPVSNNESPQFVDLRGDGQREWVMGVNPQRDQPDGEHRYMAYLTPGAQATDPWQIHRISLPSAPGTMKYEHGLGVGDINSDGRKDVVVPAGWWEAPAETAADEPWKFHAAPLGQPAAHMLVYDYDGDGDSDVISSSAHAFGIWWHEQTGPNTWQTHEIDMSFSQTHSMCLADFDQDGLPDFATGKRWWAHAAGDPGVDQPAVMYWFRLTRENGRPKWTAHKIDDDSGVGTQFEVADVNGDGWLDIATSNKKGVHIFLQERDSAR